MAINLTKLSVDVNNIQGLSDRPNSIDGLTSAELKAKFDKAGSDIKTYINGTLTNEVQENLNQIKNTGTTNTTDIDAIEDSYYEVVEISDADLANYTFEE